MARLVTLLTVIWARRQRVIKGGRLWGADGDGVVKPGEGHRFVVRIRQLRGMNGRARSYYPTTASCFNGGASRRFRINGLMGVERVTKENTPNENPKLVP